MGEITVGHLKRLLAKFPDDTRIVVSCTTSTDFLKEPASFAEKFYFNQGRLWDTIGEAVADGVTESQLELVISIS